MLDETPFSVVADFFPAFAGLDKWTHLEPLSRVPTAVICGTARQDHRHRPQPQAAREHPRLRPARVRGRRSHGDHGEPRRGQHRPRRAARPGRAPVTLHVRRVGPEAADDVLAVVRSAFGARPALDPPADALGETAASIAAALAGHGGLLAVDDDEPVGALVLDPDGDTLFLRRFGVVPYARHHGVAAALLGGGARGGRRLPAASRCWPGEELPATVRFWHHEGFTDGRARTRRTSGSSGPAPRRTTCPTRTPCAPSAVASRRRSGAGDLVVLAGRARRGQDDLHPGPRRGARGPRRDHLADVRHRPRASLAGGRPGARARRRLPARRHRGARRPRPGRVPRRGGDRRRVGERADRGSGARPGSRSASTAPSGGDPLDPDGPDPRRVLVAPVGPRWLDAVAVGG